MDEVSESASIPSTSEDIGSEVTEGEDGSRTEKEGQGVAEDDAEGELSRAPELQQLLQRLEAKNESRLDAGQNLQRIVVRVEGNHTHIQSWLSDGADDSSVLKCRVLLGAQAKLRLMQVIGSCRTLFRISVYQLTGNELEALLAPIQSNPVLRYMVIISSNSSAAETAYATDAYTESIYEILGRILRTSRTLKALSLNFWGLTTAGACHLTSGVRSNAESGLEYLCIGKWDEPSVANQIAEIVLSAPRLETLAVVDGGVMDVDAIDALASALAKSTSLTKLVLAGGVVRGASAWLLKALTGHGSNKSITTLRLTPVSGEIGDLLPLLLTSNHTLKELGCSLQGNLSPSQWRTLGQSFSSSSSLERFRIYLDWSCLRGEAIDSGEGLLSLLDVKHSCVGMYLNTETEYFKQTPFWFKSEWKNKEARELLGELNTKNPTIELHVFLGHLRDLTTIWVRVAEAVRSRVSHLSSLYLQMSRAMRQAKGGDVDSFFQALAASSTLRLLTVDGGRSEYWPGGWKQLIDCLRFNTSITHLRFIDCNDLHEDVFKQFMGVLQVNLSLKKIRLTGTSWETDGKKALIGEALRRNADRDSYFSTFRKHGLPLQTATNGRLFLCGSPLAGKTKLRQTIARILRGKSWLGNKLDQLWRTKGVEVEVLKGEEELHIAVWDLAGQWIFRTLQDTLFPRTNYASIFLFVFSPYDRENRRIKKNLDQCFKKDLEEWLRFIASNSQITGGVLPQVLVVISHMDKMRDRDVSWANSILAELGEQFHKILDICENLFQVNACRKKEVAPLKTFIFDTFRDLLRDETPIAPKVSSQITSLLAKRTENIKDRPVWPSEDFYRFCFSHLEGIVDPTLTPESPEGLEICKAMASHLHDTGSIIIISSDCLDLIIVDPNWLTNAFLGELITMGHHFQLNSSKVHESELAPLSSKSGFVSSSYLQFLLSSFLGKHQEFRNLDRTLLEKLLTHFDLCYKLGSEEADAQYYIPTIVCEDSSFRGLESGWRTAGREPLTWSSSLGSNKKFIGFRLECENRRSMSMTAALYPRFQIYIRQKLMREMRLRSESVICSRDYMRLHMDGHEILVERGDMAKSHIDVLVKCSQYKPWEIAVQYVEEHIIEEFRKFCASPKGCPGIALVIGVLQTKCVEMIVPLAYRGDSQAILIRELKEKLEGYIRKHVEDMKTESWNGGNSSLLNYEHPWPSIPGYLADSFELARELLPESEVESVTKNVLRKKEEQWKLLDLVSEEMHCETDQGPCVSEAVVEVGSLALEVGDPCSAVKINPSRSETSIARVLGSEVNFVIQKLEDKIDERFDGLEHKIDEKFDGLERTMQRIEKNMAKIISLQDKLQASLSTFMSKLDRTIGYAESLEQSRTPKRPYLNFDGVSRFEKVMAVFCLGKAVRLHFMCESIVGPHFVKDQPGLLLSLEKENMEWLRCIYDISFKMIYYLVKAGLHVTLGLGQAVPELGSLEAALPLSIASASVDNIRIDGSSTSVRRSEDMTLDEAWSRLRSVLGAKLENNYTALFNLYRVKYLNLGGRYAWVCEQCMTKGIRNRSLESL